MIHVRSVVTRLWFERTFNTEAAFRTYVSSDLVLRVALGSITNTEETTKAITTYSKQTSFITELSWITTNTVFYSHLASTWLVGSFGALHRRWGTCGTVTAIWAVCAIRLIYRHFFRRTSSTPEAFTTLFGWNYVSCSITVIPCCTG